MIVRQAVVGPFAENTWVLGCTESREALLVDPGGDLPRVRALLDSAGLRVVRILLTHGHVDHAAGAEAAREAFDAPIQLHAGDAEWLRRLPEQAAMFGFDEEVRVPTVARWHEDGEEVAFGRRVGKVLHVPGHSQGSCALWFERERVLVTGDTLFAGSVGRTDLPGGDFEALRRSIVERILPLGDDVTFHPGHGPAGRLGDERRSNPFVGEQALRGRFL